MPGKFKFVLGIINYINLLLCKDKQTMQQQIHNLKILIFWLSLYYIIQYYNIKTIRMRKLKKVTLSESLEIGLIKKDSINLKSRSITTIDCISSYLTKQIKTLDLSNNNISTLDQIVQFPKLQFLNISNNRIIDGKQLLSLYGCLKLKQVYLCNNPFLEEPLDQQVLELILQKDTDIQILSGNALASIKQIQNGEIKLIFLQNYRNKIKYHDQLKKKIRSKSIIQSPLKNHQKIITNIIPEYYERLQDSQIKRNIKKEAIQIKRDNFSTIQEAIQIKKKKQEQLVNNLLSNLTLMVQQQERGIPLVQTNLIKQNKKLIIPKRLINKSITRQSNKGDHFQSSQVLKTQQIRNSNIKSKNVIPQLESQEERPVLQPIKQIISPVSNTSQMNNHTTFELSSSINDISNYEAIYYRSLTKNNPIYSLLYSPISSLKKSEKDQLIEALSKDHRQISIDLLREKSICSDLRKQLKNLQQDSLIQSNRLIKHFKEIKDDNQKKSQESIKIKKQFDRVAESLKNSFDKIKYLEAVIHQKQAQLKDSMEQYRRVERFSNNLFQKVQKIQHQQINQDIISQNRNQMLKKKYFGTFTMKATKWYNFLKKTSNKAIQREKQLKIQSWKILSHNQKIFATIKLNEKKRNQSLLKHLFINWKIQYIHQKNQRHLKLIFQKQALNFMLKFLQHSIKTKTVKITKNKLADNHIRRKVIEKVAKYLKILRKITKTKEQRSEEYYEKNLKKRYFKIIKEQIKNNFEKMVKLKTFYEIMLKNKLLKRLILQKHYNLTLTKKEDLLKKYKKMISWNEFKKRNAIINKKQQLKVKRVIKSTKRFLVISFYKKIINKKINKSEMLKMKIQLQNFQKRTMIINLRNFYLERKQQKNKQKILKIRINNLIKLSLLAFYKHFRLNYISGKNGKLTLAMTDRYLRRQRQWLNKITLEDQRVQALVSELNISNQMLAQARQKQFRLLKDTEQLQYRLEYQDKVVLATDAQLRGFKHDILTLQGKHTELLKNYCETIDYISRKDQQQRKGFVENTTDYDFGFDTKRQASRSLEAHFQYIKTPVNIKQQTYVPTRIPKENNLKTKSKTKYSNRLNVDDSQFLFKN